MGRKKSCSVNSKKLKEIQKLLESGENPETLVKKLKRTALGYEIIPFSEVKEGDQISGQAFRKQGKLFVKKITSFNPAPR